MEDIIKVSETEVQISIPQPAIVEVKSKDQLIREKEQLVERKTIEISNWNERLAILNAEIAKYDAWIDQATVLAVKTQAELNII